MNFPIWNIELIGNNNNIKTKIIVVTSIDLQILPFLILLCLITQIIYIRIEYNKLR